ncbi:ATP-grasp domain-containing protein [Chthonobacter albigriseus]|uniref:ATP-grasp domain-containing protein n=1 Tax=Chthonobacter albigriseus TaxID=1683161 RepID=UPI0015EE9AF6|nr:ATP-grasp domain-containing protein [Chthonobacter albigriseus]
MSRPALLVVAQSARSLATAAVRAGYAPIAVDFFADEDTRALALAAERVSGGLRCGFRRAALMPAIETALRAAAVEPVGIVLGSGFEDRTRLVASLAARWSLLGCPAEVVRAVNDPFRLAEACRIDGIPHPEVRRDVPTEGEWLVRRRGAAGGGHIRPIAAGEPVPTGHVVMRRVPGRPVSAAVLADGGRAEVFAFAEQILAPADEAPFRFAGVAGPVRLPATVEQGMRHAADKLAARFGLKGLASLDAMVDGNDWWLLEVNPRPGASLDALDHMDAPLLTAHISAVAGRILLPRAVDATIRATMVVYASVDSSVTVGPKWPDWVLDRPGAGARIEARAPIATITAAAERLEDIEGLLTTRARELETVLRGNAT